MTISRCRIAQEASSNKAKLQVDIKYLNRWLVEMADKVNAATCVAKKEARRATKSSILVSKRLEVLKDLKLHVSEL